MPSQSKKPCSVSKATRCLSKKSINGFASPNPQNTTRGALRQAYPKSFTQRTAFTTEPKFLNVKNYGAKGDGTIDDTDVINKAIIDGPGRCIDKCNSRTTHPAIVYFPPGTYPSSQKAHRPDVLHPICGRRSEYPNHQGIC
ncbi:pectate lyase superfamily protein-domain-containing protein [Xylaria flabelliformis]|nr:pectate lyase superfamily protein-domain-containing protein [Xylaria flabelliformis]